MKREWHCLLISFLIVSASSCSSEEGDSSCASDISSFTGIWNITEQCGATEFSYPLTITQNSSGGITLTNLGDGGTGSLVNATISVNGGFDIYPQNVQGYTITGNGALNGGCAQIVIQWSGGANGGCISTGSH